jgi:acyl carrier protein
LSLKLNNTKQPDAVGQPQSNSHIHGASNRRISDDDWSVTPMDLQAIRAKVKESIQKVTGIDAATISDSAAYVDELGLDSLSILEIAVCVEESFGFHASDEELSEIRTVDDTVELVKKRACVEAA